MATRILKTSKKGIPRVTREVYKQKLLKEINDNIVMSTRKATLPSLLSSRGNCLAMNNDSPTQIQ